MTVRLYFLLTVFIIILPVSYLTAQSIYKTTQWGYRKYLFGGYDTVSANARRSNYVIEKYNERNQLTDVEEHNPDSTLTKRIQYVFDEKGHPYSEIHYAANGAISLQKKLTGNEKGWVYTAEWSWRSKGDVTITYHETYAYDSIGRVIKKTLVETPYGSTYTWFYTYKNIPDGYEMTTKMHRTHPKKTTVSLTRYNSNGDPVYEKTKGYIIIKTYDYDASGQWTVRKMSHRDGVMMPWFSEWEWRKEKIK
jgi:hypothetical protein